MTTMKACVFHGPGKLTIEELPIPTPGPGQVLLKTGAASLCFSDIRVYKGEKSAQPEMTLGHEVAGTVVAVGDDVVTPSVGDRVTACPIVSCGQCYYCQMGKQNRCQQRATLGYDHHGGLAEYVLMPATLVGVGHLLRVPESLPFDVACQTEPFACALYSLETCQVGAGSSVAIIGSGPMGLTHLLLAKSLGAARILVVDKMEERLAVARRMGATQAVNPDDEDIAQVALEMTDGLGFDAVIVSVGNVQAIESAMPLARKQGWINIFGGSPPESFLRMDPNLVHYSELFVTGTQNAPVEHYRRALELLTTVPEEVRGMVTHRFGISDAINAFEARIQLDGLKAVIEFPE